MSHRSAPVSLRERLAYSAGDLRSALERFRASPAGSPLAGAEFLILSTCNRTELYLAPADGHAAGERPGDATCWDALTDFLAESRGLSRDAFAPHVYRLAGIDAVRHLSRVAAGLESMVLGEAEILGQVNDAREAATEIGTLGPVLTAALQCAVRAGRRARSETGICRQPASVSSEAADLIAREGGEIAARRILLVGTGPVARRAGEVLREQGATDLHVISRTWAHAEGLAAALGATARPWCDLEGAVRESDVVLCATGAPHVVLTEAMVRSALLGRAEGRGLLLIDTALPRDIDPPVREVPGVRLFDLDDLQSRLQQHLEQRRQESPRVEAVVREEIEAFEEWLRGTSLRPLLSAMHQRGEAIRRQEVERLLRRLPELPEEARRQVEQLSHALVNKLLHEPSARLRAERDPGRRGAYAQVAQHLFGLSDELGGVEAQSAVSE